MGVDPSLRSGCQRRGLQSASVRIALTLDRDASKREENDYVRALMGAGFRREEIVILPPGSPVGEEFDGVVIGGGCDVDPSRYGESPRPDANLEVDPERDQTDFALFERARRSRTPTLAICRGLQVVNVALGGTLIQDLPTERPLALEHQRAETKRDKTRLDHTVRIAPGTRLSGIAEAPELPVNSRHHQAIGRAAPGLTVAAVAPDGVIEAVETTEPWLLGVQWHPENLAGADAPSRRLFEEFALAVRARAPAARD
jgi:putative glutamine amidotransferase